MQPLKQIEVKPLRYEDLKTWLDKVTAKEGRDPTLGEFYNLISLFDILFDSVIHYRNDIYDVARSTRDPRRLSIRRLDSQPIHNWKDFQEIKNQIYGPDVTMIEYYPPESQLLDTDNIYHLFVTDNPLPWYFGRHIWSK